MTSHLKRLIVVGLALVLAAGGLSTAPLGPRYLGLAMVSSPELTADLERFSQEVVGYSVGEDPSSEPDAPGPDWLIN